MDHKTYFKVNGENATKLEVSTGVTLKRCNSVSPILFNIVMDDTIESLQKELRYEMTDIYFNLIRLQMTLS